MSPSNNVAIRRGPSSSTRLASLVVLATAFLGAEAQIIDRVDLFDRKCGFLECEPLCTDIQNETFIWVANGFDVADLTFVNRAQQIEFGDSVEFEVDAWQFGPNPPIGTYTKHSEVLWPYAYGGIAIDFQFANPYCCGQFETYYGYYKMWSRINLLAGGEVTEFRYFLIDENPVQNAATPDVQCLVIPGANPNNTSEPSLFRPANETGGNGGGIIPVVVPTMAPFAETAAPTVFVPPEPINASFGVSLHIYDSAGALTEEMFPGHVIDSVFAQNMNIEAILEEPWQKVRFYLDGAVQRDEATAPYFLFGDGPGGPFTGSIAPGDHVLGLEPFLNDLPAAAIAEVPFTVEDSLVGDDASAPPTPLPTPAPTTLFPPSPAPAVATSAPTSSPTASVKTPSPTAKPTMAPVATTPAPVPKPTSSPVPAPTPMPVAAGSCPQGATMRSVAGKYTVEFESFANRDQYCNAQGTNCEGGWVEINDAPFNGIAMKWEGLNLFTSPGFRGVSTIDIYIDEPGIYVFDWISGFTGTESTEENDSWVRINADSSFAMYDPLNGTKHFARGCGPPPYPEGSSGDCYYKVFRTGFGKYWWNAKTGDNEAFDVYAQFNEAKVYTMDIAARSIGHKIDKIAMYKLVDGDGNRVNADQAYIDSARAMAPEFC